MNFKTPILTAALLASTAMSAQAMEVKNTEATIGYNSISQDGGADLDGTFVKGGVTVQTGSFTTDLGLSHGGLGHDDTATVLSVAPSMDVAPGAKIGAFVDYSMLSADDSTATHYGLTGEYAIQDLTISGFYGMGDYETGDIETTVYGVAANYDLPGAFDAGAFYDMEDVDGGNEVTRLGVRTGYDMSVFSVPVYASVSLAQVDDGTNDDQVIGLGFSIPLGDGGTVKKAEKRAHDRSLGVAGSFFE